MAIKVFLILAIVLYFSCNRIVEGVHRKLSVKEDLEIEKQLNRLNKPSLKSIKTEHGDVYDCVDFFKQPAFDHPLLKNHTFHYEMRPSFMKKTRFEKQTNNVKHKFGLPDGGCPIGTVPIRRSTKEDLIRSKALTDGTQLLRSVLRTKTDPNRKYYGAAGNFSVYNPRVTPSQSSSTQISIKNGDDTIQVGWTVNPALYGDTNTRLFTFFRAGGISCFNTRCPGFVIVDTQFPLDGILKPISQRGKHIRELHLFVQQDAVNGNWWLEFLDNDIQLGFWPKNIFNGLKDFATYVDWGGEVNIDSQEKLPEMGSGYQPIGDTNFDGFGVLLSVVNDNHKIVDADFTEPFSDANDYLIEDRGIRSDKRLGHVILFGGPK